MYGIYSIYGMYGVLATGGMMLKKTTVYLSPDEITLLKKKATLQNKTIAEVIRFSIRQACQPISKEEQHVWDSLDKIWAKTDKISEAKIESAVDEAVKEVRRGKKASKNCVPCC